MRRDEVFPSKYLKATDLGRTGMLLTIAAAEMESIKDSKVGEKQLMVVRFQEVDKGLTLNQVNWESIESITGQDDSDLWVGHQIDLYPAKTQFNGKVVDCIRIRPPAQPGAKQYPATPAQARPPAQAKRPELVDDEIPF